MGFWDALGDAPLPFPEIVECKNGTLGSWLELAFSVGILAAFFALCALLFRLSAFALNATATGIPPELPRSCVPKVLIICAGAFNTPTNVLGPTGLFPAIGLVSENVATAEPTPVTDCIATPAVPVVTGGTIGSTGIGACCCEVRWVGDVRSTSTSSPMNAFSALARTSCLSGDSVALSAIDPSCIGTPLTNPASAVKTTGITPVFAPSDLFINLPARAVTMPILIRIAAIEGEPPKNATANPSPPTTHGVYGLCPQNLPPSRGLIGNIFITAIPILRVVKVSIMEAFSIGLPPNNRPNPANPALTKGPANATAFC